MSIKHDRSQVTPRNVVLIGGLGLWLVYLIVGGEKPTSATRSKTPPTAQASPNVTQDETKKLSDFAGRHTRQEAWNRLAFHVNTEVKHDPFARLDETVALSVAEPPPGEFAQPEDSNAEAEAEVESERMALADAKRRELDVMVKQRNARKLAELIASIEGQEIDAVYEADGKTTALIGSRSIAEGDLLADGIRVLRITSSGMTVSVEPEISADTQQKLTPSAISPRIRSRTPKRERR